MRSAPAVDYPLGGTLLRDVQRWIAAFFVFLLAAWSLQTRPGLTLACTGWALALTILVVARRLATREATGSLSWNGRMWWLHPAPQHRRHGFRPAADIHNPTPTRVEVIWDGQHWLVLFLRPSGRAARWACVVRAKQGPRWLALRRALMRDGVARVEAHLRGGHV